MNFFKNTKAFLKMLTSLSIFMLLSLFSYSQTGQKATLVKDIRVGNDGSYPASFTSVGNIAYFTTDAGTSLWKSDGTNAGTVILGTTSSNPQGYNGKLYYTTRYQMPNPDNQQVVLWSYNGSTSTVVDTIKASNGLIRSIMLSTIGSNLVIDVDFYSSFSTSQSNIVRFLSKGIKNTTRQSGNTFIKDGGCGIYSYTNFYLADTLAFYEESTSICGNPGGGALYSVKTGLIWRSRVFPQFNVIKTLGVIGSRLIFAAPVNNNDPFVVTNFNLYSVGVNGDSLLLKSNIGVISPYQTFKINSYKAFNNKIYFSDDYNRIWETDGTVNGTVLLTDGVTNTLPLHMNTPIALDNGLYFYDSYNNDFRIWQITTTGSIRKVMSIPTSSNNNIYLANLNNELWQFGTINTNSTAETPIYLYKIDVVNGARQSMSAAYNLGYSNINGESNYVSVGSKLLVSAKDSLPNNQFNATGQELYQMPLDPSITNCSIDDIAPYFGYCPANTVKNITADRDTAWYPTPTAFDNCPPPQYLCNCRVFIILQSFLRGIE